MDSAAELAESMIAVLAPVLSQFTEAGLADIAERIFLDALPGRRGGAAQHLGPELEAELPVLYPAALRGHPLTGADRWEGADDGDLIAVALGFDLEHGETVFLVEESDALDQPG